MRNIQCGRGDRDVFICSYLNTPSLEDKEVTKEPLNFKQLISLLEKKEWVHVNALNLTVKKWQAVKAVRGDRDIIVDTQFVLEEHLNSDLTTWIRIHVKVVPFQ